jgi:hypothetical protein
MDDFMMVYSGIWGLLGGLVMHTWIYCCMVGRKVDVAL